MSKNEKENGNEMAIKELEEYVKRFSALDNDTLMFVLSAIDNKERAIMAINTITKARRNVDNSK